MPVNDWNNLGRDVKDIVQHAINSGDFSALNRDLGATLDSALGNVAQSMKRAGNAYSNKYSYKPFGGYRNPSQRERMKEAREEFALFVNTNGAKALGLLFTTLGIALTIMFGRFNIFSLHILLIQFLISIQKLHGSRKIIIHKLM
jgi:hypothetical protein